MRKRHSTKRFFICTKLGHLSKNYMNTTRIEDEKKAKADNIKKQIIQQQVPKYPYNASQNHEVDDTQVNELGDIIISTQFPMEITKTVIMKKSSSINSSQPKKEKSSILAFKIHNDHLVITEVQDLTKYGQVTYYFIMKKLSW